MIANITIETMISVSAKPASDERCGPGRPPRRRLASRLRIAVRPCRWGRRTGSQNEPWWGRAARAPTRLKSGFDRLAVFAGVGPALAGVSVRDRDGEATVAVVLGVHGGVPVRQVVGVVGARGL